MDWFKPILYALEKRATSRSIPDVSRLPDRWKLQVALLEDHDPSSSSSSSFDHSLWDQVLKRHIYTGCQIGSISNCNCVDYDGIAKDESFHQYLAALEAVHLEELSRPEQLALWINAYNALCIHLIITREEQRRQNCDDAPLPPLQSINELSNNNNNNDHTDGYCSVWDQVAGSVGGIEISLNGIEHVQLRSQWDEPSIHSCIVCASASCPNLRNEAFVAARLSDQMRSQMNEWLANPTKGLCLQQQDDDQLLWLSRIFLWFGNDFGNTMSVISTSFPFFGNVTGEKHSFRAWLAQFVASFDKELATRIEYSNDSFRYFDYDWQINRWTGNGTDDEASPDLQNASK